MTTVDSKRARVATLPGGIELPYIEQGSRDGLPLVLLHGFSDHWRSFAPVLPELPPDIRALAVTQRGHAGASQPRRGYGIPDLAADTLAFLYATEIDRAVLAGHSLGALNALQAAIDAPDRVAGLVLGPGFAKAESTPGVEELVSAAQAITDPVDRGFAELLQVQALEPQLPAGLFAAMVQGTVEMPARVWRALTAGIMAFDARDELDSISAPVLLIWGEQDEIVPRSTQATLVARLRAAELSVHPGGHTPHWDDPKRYAAEVTRFVRSAFASSAD